jgi:spermidine/putrescine transport system permease protein/putrescine transport system permease protein
MLLNLVSPEIATAIALLLLFTGVGLRLGSDTIALGHITFSIAYVTVIVRARLLGIGHELEEGAMDLGATELQSLRLVVLPLMWPAILGSAMLVFLLSFDDFVTSFFTAGVGTPPLPLLIYGMIRFGVTPEINAIGTLMMATTILVGVGGIALIQFRTTPTGRSA